jgi:hypothetical protein
VSDTRDPIYSRTLAAAEALLPHEGSNPAAVAITFPAGDYVVPTANTTEDASALRHLLAAYFLHKEPPPRQLRTEALRLTFAVLRLANHVSAAAGIDRFGHATVPVSRDQLSQALRLPQPELARITSDYRASLEPLITDDHDGAVWSATPVLRDGDSVVVVGADELLAALRHHLIVLAEHHGWRDALAERVADAYAISVGRSLERLGWSETEFSADDELPTVHDLWAFDADAGAVVSVLSDDLNDYDTDNPEAPWRAERFLDAMAERSRALLTELYMGPRGPNRLMHLVVLAGVARPSMWFDSAPDPVLEAPMVSFYAGDLEVISMAERGDPLALWRFAVDSDRAPYQFMAGDPLELFGVWRSNTHSFYLGDERPPTFLTSTGQAEQLRAEVAQQIDRHSVPGPTGRGLVEVVRRFDELDVPLYQPLTSDIAGVAVEAGGLRAWVLASTADRAVGQLVDAVAFWIWQLADVIDRESLEVTVSVPDHSGLRVAEGEPGHLAVSFNPERMPGFQRPDNAGERELVRTLLETLHSSWDPADIADVVDDVAPLGPKKMVLAFDDAEEALDSRNLPPARPPLRDSEDAEAMDELGVYLRTECGLREGAVAPDKRVEVLWSAIEFHLNQLLALIASLRPEGALEALVAVNERLLNEGAFNRYTVPTRQACFGETTDIAGNLLRDTERHAAASTALRFVIECVAAQPPQGIRPMTLAVQDRLVGLAFQVCARGGVSDAIREGLDDTKVSVLPSGRLGVSREGRFYGRRGRFVERFVDAEVCRAHEFFPSLWRTDTPREEADSDAALLNAAATHEWGATMSEILELFDALVHISNRSPATTLPLSAAVTTLAELLDWDEEKVVDLIGQFALTARDELLAPPPPFEPADVYPWRYGRRLSAVRRPLIIRPGRDGDELVYGFRAVDSAGRQLVDDLQKARLKVSSPQMQQAMTRLRQREDLQFNRRIASLYEAVPGLIVKQNVKQIGRVPIARPNGDSLGDIDVLVADQAERVLRAVETKNLAPGRTPIEIARELRRTFKSEGTRTAAIDKHVERAAWLTRHRTEVLEWLGLDITASSRWRVEPLIVVSSEVTAPFLEELPMPVLDAAQLADELTKRADADLIAPASTRGRPPPTP